jgi:thymidylate synthase
MGFDLLVSKAGRRQVGRNGPTKEVMRVCFELTNPRERWVSSRRPAINPAFALAEVVWTVNGRNDSWFLNFWNTRLPEFAGRGSTYDGAYGHRLRVHHGSDQLIRAASALRCDSSSRQVVLQLWDARCDLPLSDASPTSPDIPCNVTALLKVREGRLDWLQVCRSNDIFLGLPYNFVQFTYLQEVIAGWIGVPPGVYTHLSDSLHLYERDLVRVRHARSNDVRPSDDIVSLPRAHSERLWLELARRTELLAKGAQSPQAHVSVCRWDDAPQSFQNMLHVLGAEAAWRRGWRFESKEIIEMCQSQLLSDLWAGWRDRAR